MELQYGASHLYTIWAKKNELQVTPEERDRVKQSIAYRLLCVTEGECHMFVSGVSCRLQKNDLCFLRPGDVYRTVPIQRMRLLNLYFSFDREDAERIPAAADSNRSDLVKRYSITDVPMLNQPFVLKNDAEGIRIAERVAAACPVMAIPDQKYRDIQLELLMMHVISQREQQEYNRRQNTGNRQRQAADCALDRTHLVGAGCSHHMRGCTKSYALRHRIGDSQQPAQP